MVAVFYDIAGVVIAVVYGRGDKMLVQKRPLESGTDTEIDLIEREMEGGVIIEQPSEFDDDTLDRRLGVFLSIEERVRVRQLDR